jgi:S1-C subfamily serine protease
MKSLFRTFLAVLSLLSIAGCAFRYSVVVYDSRGTILEGHALAKGVGNKSPMLLSGPGLTCEGFALEPVLSSGTFSISCSDGRLIEGNWVEVDLKGIGNGSDQDGVSYVVEFSFYPADMNNVKLRAREFAAKSSSQPPPSESSQSSSGSGFFVSKMGHVITNAHVVKDCQGVTVGDNTNNQTSAELISSDTKNDLALLKLSSLEMASLETETLVRKLEAKIMPLASEGLLRPEVVELGEKVMVAGYPYGDIFSNTIKVTGGMVSATRGIGDDTSRFQLDAAVQPGNSGGPIYDDRGNIVGVVVSQLNKLNVAKATGSLPENVNFGIKASTVRQFLTSSGIPTKWSQRSKEVSNKELAKIAQNQALMVMCLN